MSSFTSDVMSSSIGGQLPALLPPPGQSSNFADPDSQGHIYTGVATAIIAMMIVLVTTRQYTKYFIVRKLGWDDLTCLIAEIFSISYYINCQYEVFAGHVGTHMWNVPFSYIISERWLIPVYLGVVLVPPAMIFTKLTFYLVYLQVFRPFAWLRICVYIGSAITTAFYLGVWIYLLVSITPRNGQSFMTVALSPAQFKSLRTSVPIAGVGLATDLYLLVLPIAAVMQLQLPTRRKIGVILIFLTGLAACIASAFSVYYRVVLNRNNDYTWNLMPVNICTVAEMGIGLCCVSMPALSKMVTYHLPKFEPLRSWLSSRYSGIKSTTLHSSFKQPPGLLKKLRSKGSKSSVDGYSDLDLENHQDARLRPNAPKLGPLPYELGQMQTSVRTLIGTGTSPQYRPDGIHVKVNMQQDSRHC